MAAHDPTTDSEEPDPYPPVPEPPPPPPIPEVLRRPVERPGSMTKPPVVPPVAFQAASGYASAFSFIGTVLVFGGLGWLVDWLTGTGPWGLVMGIAFGFIGGTYRLLRDANRPIR